MDSDGAQTYKSGNVTIGLIFAHLIFPQKLIHSNLSFTVINTIETHKTNICPTKPGVPKNVMCDEFYK